MPYHSYSRRVAAEYSTVFRTYGELFPQKAGQSEIEDRPHHNRPELFTAFLSSDARVDKRRRSLGFSLDLGVLVPNYEIDGLLWMKDHSDGGYHYREKINLEAIPPSKNKPQWGLRYGYDSRTPNRVSMKAEATPGPAPDTLEFRPRRPKDQPWDRCSACPDRMLGKRCLPTGVQILRICEGIRLPTWK